MKNLILVFAAIAFSAGVYAQTDSKNTNTNQGDMNNKQQNMYNNDVDKSHPQGENDSTNWKTSPQDKNNNPNQNMQNKPVDTSYPEGVTDSTKTKSNQEDMNNSPNKQNKPAEKSYPDGVTDSTKTKTSQKDMSNNQNMQNNLADNSYSGRVKESTKSNQQNNSGDKLDADGVIMQNGKLMKVKNGEITILQEKSMTMDNGTQIMSDGTCIKKDGTKMTLKEGQHMDMSGNIVPMDTNKDKKMYLVPDSTLKKDK